MDIYLDKMCGKDKWAAYCISLKRCVERRSNFTKWAESIDLTFEFFDAIDKLNLNASDIDAHGTIVGKEISPGATACRMSHEALYKKILTDKIQWVFILEDDAGFIHSSKEELYEFCKTLVSSTIKPGMFQFGYHTASKIPYSCLRPSAHPSLYKYEYADQAHAILYKRNTIEVLDLLCKDPRNIRHPIDAVINIWQRKNTCIGPEISIIEQVDPISYIWT